MKKKELTPEQIEAKIEQASFNRKRSGFKRSLKSVCENGEMRLIELELDHLKSFPKQRLPKEIFDLEQTISIYEEALSEYKESLQ